MTRLAFQLVVFCFGVSLAVMLAYASKAPENTAVARTDQPSAIVGAASDPVAPAAPSHPLSTAERQMSLPLGATSRGKLAEPQSGIKIADEAPEAPFNEPPGGPLLAQLQALTPQARENLVIQAVHEGTISSLRFSSSKVLVLLPDYRENLLPTLKREALHSLLSRFRDVDWINWHLSSFARDGGPTGARSYVDLVSSVNPELGRYLETAAQLFRALAVSTKAGKPFSATEGLSAVLNSADSAVEDGSGALFDAEILSDEVFHEVLEQQRTRLILAYLDAHEEQPLINLQLLLSADPKTGAPALAPSLLHLLRRFSLEASPRYRAEVFQRLGASKRLEDWLEGSGTEQVAARRALAQLYLVGAMDAVEGEDRRRAAVFLDESIRLTPGLRGQELISAVLKESVAPVDHAHQEEPAAPPPDKEHEESAPRTSLFARDTAEKGGRLAQTLEQGISYLSLFLLVLLVAGGGLLVFLYRRSLAAVQGGIVEARAADAPRSVRMTAPNEMNFEEDRDQDSRARQSPF